MNREEQYLARIMFQNRVYECDAQAYEDLFVKVLSYSNTNFRSVAAWGRTGDKKNDGFDRASGTYYQVYAPEVLKESAKKAVEKLKTDFVGLYNYWENQSFPIQNYNYVLNDKYGGLPPDIESALTDLHGEYPNVNFNSFPSSALEDIFMGLADDKISVIVGLIPNPSNIDVLDFDVLSEVVNYILNKPNKYSKEKFPNDPNFNLKLTFNRLSTSVTHLLQAASYQEYQVKNYFTNNSAFLKTELRDRFKRFYEEGKNLFMDPDQIFFYILEQSSSSETKSVQDAVLVLMAYYFTYCDIFETPPPPPTTLDLFPLQ